MSGTIVTLPGKFGDVIWALPSIRALSERLGEPVDVMLSAAYGSLAPLINEQPYVGHCWADVDWHVSDAYAPAPLGPREPPVPTGYAHVWHGAYRDWPSLPLPYETARTLGVEIDLERPWIAADEGRVRPLVVGFSDEWFELKYGLFQLLLLGPVDVLVPSMSRWNTEAGISSTGWDWAARIISQTRVFFGCNSALHVLACAMGVPVLMMEPMEARWNDIFFPYGKSGPRVTLVTGNDGRPTFDARHCKDAINKALGR